MGSFAAVQIQAGLFFTAGAAKDFLSRASIYLPKLIFSKKPSPHHHPPLSCQLVLVTYTIQNTKKIAERDGAGRAQQDRRKPTDEPEKGQTGRRLLRDPQESIESRMKLQPPCRRGYDR